MSDEQSKIEYKKSIGVEEEKKLESTSDDTGTTEQGGSRVMPTPQTSGGGGQKIPGQDKDNGSKTAKPKADDKTGEGDRTKKDDTQPDNKKGTDDSTQNNKTKPDDKTGKDDKNKKEKPEADDKKGQGDTTTKDKPQTDDKTGTGDTTTKDKPQSGGDTTSGKPPSGTGTDNLPKTSDAGKAVTSQAPKAAEKVGEEVAKEGAKQATKAVAKEVAKDTATAVVSAPTGETAAPIVRIALEVVDWGVWLISKFWDYIVKLIEFILIVIFALLALIVYAMLSWMIGIGPGGSSVPLNSNVADQVKPVDQVQNYISLDSDDDTFRTWLKKIEEMDKKLVFLATDTIGKADTLEETDYLIKENNKILEEVGNKYKELNSINNPDKKITEQSDKVKKLFQYYYGQGIALDSLRNFNQMFECLLLKAQKGAYINKQFIDHQALSQKTKTGCKSDISYGSKLPPALEFYNARESQILLPMTQEEVALNKEEKYEAKYLTYRLLYYIYRVWEEDTPEFQRYIKDGILQQASTPTDIITFCSKNLEDNPERCSNPVQTNMCGVGQLSYFAKVNSESLDNLGVPYKQRAHLKIYLGAKSPQYSDEQPVTMGTDEDVKISDLHKDFRAFDITEIGLYNERLDCTACKGLDGCFGECIPPTPCCPLVLNSAKDQYEGVKVKWQQEKLSDNIIDLGNISNLFGNMNNNIINGFDTQTWLTSLGQNIFSQIWQTKFGNFDLSQLANFDTEKMLGYFGNNIINERLMGPLGLPTNWMDFTDWKNPQLIVANIASGYLSEALDVPYNYFQVLNAVLLDNKNLAKALIQLSAELPINLKNGIANSIQDGNRANSINLAMANIGIQQISTNLGWPSGVLDINSGNSWPDLSKKMGQKIVQTIIGLKGGNNPQYDWGGNIEQITNSIRYINSPIKVKFTKDTNKTDLSNWDYTDETDKYNGILASLGVKLDEMDFIPEDIFTTSDQNNINLHTPDVLEKNKIYLMYPKIETSDIVSGQKINDKYYTRVGQIKLLETMTNLAFESKNNPILLADKNENIGDNDFKKAFSDKFSLRYQAMSGYQNFSMLTFYGGADLVFNALKNTNSEMFGKIGQSYLSTRMSRLDKILQMNEVNEIEQKLKQYLQVYAVWEGLKDNDFNNGRNQAVEFAKKNNILENITQLKKATNIDNLGNINTKQIDQEKIYNQIINEKSINSFTNIGGLSENFSEGLGQISLSEFSELLLNNNNLDIIKNIMTERISTKGNLDYDKVKNILNNNLLDTNSFSNLSQLISDKDLSSFMNQGWDTQNFENAKNILDWMQKGEIDPMKGYEAISTITLLNDSIGVNNLQTMLTQYGDLKDMIQTDQMQQMALEALNKYPTEIQGWIADKFGTNLKLADLQNLFSGSPSDFIRNTAGNFMGGGLPNQGILSQSLISDILSGNLSYPNFINQAMPEILNYIDINANFSDLNGGLFNPEIGNINPAGQVTDLFNQLGIGNVLFDKCRQKIAKDNIIHLIDIVLSYDKDKNALDYFGILNDENGNLIDKDNNPDQLQRSLLWRFYPKQIFSDFAEDVFNKLDKKARFKFEWVWNKTREEDINLFMNDCNRRQNPYLKKCVEAIHVGF